ncbi:MAG: hypothetical protein LBD68_07615 [Zoogloeaceae bacterium]|nr:hypothetical protein [Zoogloeaceae bacterium]
MLQRIGLIAASMLVFAANALAAPDEQVCADDIHATIERDLHIENFAGRAQEDRRFIVSQACRIWPYAPEYTLAALAYDEGVENEKNIVVAIIDRERKRVISSKQWKIEEDALTEIGEYSLKLDTARYQLAGNVRAFGLRFQSSATGASCPDARFGDTLILLFPQGKSLRQVLDLYMYHQRAIQGCLSGQVPNVIWEEAVLAVGIENTRTNGFYDLRVTASISPGSNEEPTGSAKKRVERVILRYNGKHYEASGKSPWWLLWSLEPPFMESPAVMLKE